VGWCTIDRRPVRSEISQSDSWLKSPANVMLQPCQCQSAEGKKELLEAAFHGWINVTDGAVVAAAADVSRLHNVNELRLPASSTAAAEPPSLVLLSANNRATDAAGHCSGGTTSPGITDHCCC